jgi:hypothetical protein
VPERRIEEGGAFPNPFCNIHINDTQNTQRHYKNRKLNFSGMFPMNINKHSLNKILGNNSEQYICQVW